MARHQVEVDRDQLIALLRDIRERLERAGTERDRLIRASRAAGATWAQIGEALDIGKQGAHHHKKRLGL